MWGQGIVVVWGNREGSLLGLKVWVVVKALVPTTWTDPNLYSTGSLMDLSCEQMVVKSRHTVCLIWHSFGNEDALQCTWFSTLWIWEGPWHDNKSKPLMFGILESWRVVMITEWSKERNPDKNHWLHSTHWTRVYTHSTRTMKSIVIQVTILF